MSLTISGLGRALACPTSEVLPHTKHVGNRYASKGSVIHAYLRDVSTLGAEEALMQAPEEDRDALEAIDLDALPVDPSKYAPEVAFAWDPRHDEAKEIGRGDGARDYRADGRADLIFGTADVVGLTADAVVVMDYKTGRSDIGPAKKNAQLLGYCCAARLAYTRDRAIAFIVRLREDGSVWFERVELGPLELDAFSGQVVELLAMVERIRSGDMPQTPVEGEHCKFCPAFTRCPAKVALAAAMGAGTVVVVDEMELTDAMAPAFYRRLLVAEQVVEKARAILVEYASHRFIDLGDGYVYGARERTKEKLDPVLSEPLLPEPFRKAIQTEVTLSKRALEAEVKKVVPKGRGASTMREVLGVLRNAGAIGKVTYQVVERFKPKPELAAGTTEEE